MQTFGFAGLWKHVATTVISAGILVADAVLSYFGTVSLPAWAHALVGVVAAVLAVYKGRLTPPVIQG